MITTFTTATDLSAEQQNENGENLLPEFAEPSAQVLMNILNYSRSLEIRRSQLIDEVEFVKS